jgi:hypothetical protein
MESKSLSKSEMKVWLAAHNIHCIYGYGVVTVDGSNVVIRMQMDTAFIPGDVVFDVIGLDGKQYKGMIEYYKV